MRAMRFVVAVAVMCLALSAAYSAQQARDNRAEVALQAAIKVETIDGDLKAAIEAYKNVVATCQSNRAVAAHALVHMGQRYERLGDTESRKAYERLVREFPDQKDVADQARARLAALAARRPAASRVSSSRQFWTGRYSDPPHSVSPDGRYLAQEDSQTGDLILHDVVTGEVRRLTNDARPGQEDNLRPVLSPDGQRIAYQRRKAGGWEIRLIGLDASKPRILCSVTSAGRDWSPDGRSFVYTSKPESGPVVSADGTQLAVIVSDMVSSFKEIKVLPAAGRAPRTVFSGMGDEISGMGAGWAPGGKAVLIVRGRGDSFFTGTTPPAALWRVPIDGSAPTPTGVAMEELTNPRVSPDGTHIRFDGRRDVTEIWAIDNVLPTVAPASGGKAR